MRRTEDTPDHNLSGAETYGQYIHATGDTSARLLIVCSFVFFMACTHSGKSAADADAREYLFVQTASSATIEGDRLTLYDVAAHTIFFSDRPSRITGHLPVSELVNRWSQGPHSFRDDPPNASLAFVSGGGDSVAVFELRDPELEGNDLSFRVRLLEGTPPRNVTDPSLFIDAGGLMQLVAYGAQD